MKKTLAIIGLLSTLVMAMPAFATSLPVGGTQYYLAGAGVTTGASTIQLTSFKTADGRPITMSMFGTIGYGALDPQTTTKLEDVTFSGITQNGNGTALLTGVTRGNDFVYPYTASTTLARSHSGGSTFILTNTAGYYYDQFTMNNNNNLFTWPTASSSPSTKGYVDYVAFNGAAVINANTTNKGVVEIATPAEVAASTAIGGTGATVVIPASVATSTYNAATSANVIPVTGLSGKIDSNFIATSTLGLHANIQVFTSSGVWSKPSGAVVVEALLIGGGGGGGGGGNNGTASGGGNGGGDGGFTLTKFDASALTATTSVTVGAAGTGGAAGTSGNSGSSGTGGGASTFGVYASANGGTVGLGGSSSGGAAGIRGIQGTGYLSGNGGGGGNGNGGAAAQGGSDSPMNPQIVTGGATGAAGTNATANMGILGGAGGGGTNSTAGGAGGLYGGGGGGGGTQTAAAGAAGAKGIAIIISYQ